MWYSRSDHTPATDSSKGNLSAGRLRQRPDMHPVQEDFSLFTARNNISPDRHHKFDLVFILNAGCGKPLALI